MRRFVAFWVIFALALSACQTGLPPTPPDSNVNLAPALEDKQPKTIAAATAAAQELADRNSAGDYAGVWQLMSKQVRDGISEADFVTLYDTCYSSWKAIAAVTGVRMDGPDKAIVRLEQPKSMQTRTMVYEDGKWVQAPLDFIAKLLGKPVGQMIDEEKVVGRCKPK